MEVKLFEVRDRGTFIPAFGIRMRSEDAAEQYLLSRAGYGRFSDCILFGNLDSGNVFYDPFDWMGSRTMHEAHVYIEKNWSQLVSGQVVCVETILGERETPKISERISADL